MMVEFSTWAWPQWVFFGMMAFTLFTNCLCHGQARAYSAGTAVVDFAWIFAVLYAGGFWSAGP